VRELALPVLQGVKEEVRTFPPRLHHRFGTACPVSAYTPKAHTKIPLAEGYWEHILPRLLPLNGVTLGTAFVGQHLVFLVKRDLAASAARAGAGRRGRWR
jgi:hypothetical protein